jgi:hypothetical protein
MSVPYSPLDSPLDSLQRGLSQKTAAPSRDVCRALLISNELTDVIHHFASFRSVMVTS